MQIAVHPRYVDSVAKELATLQSELAESRCFVGRVVREGEYGEVLRLATAQLARYQERHEELAAHAHEITRQFGAFCPQGEYSVLVGAEWMIRAKDNTLCLLACVEADQPAKEK
jgi:hypothetical protein